MKEDLSVSFLYNTVIGRSVLKLLVRKRISEFIGRILSLRVSVLLIKPFMKKNNISLEDIDVPLGGFSSFNEFFRRKRKNKFLKYDNNTAHFISPCDGFLSYVDMDADSVFYIKGSRYTLASLLRDKKLAEEFRNGTAVILRLTPAHYHRYSFIDTGKIIAKRRIPGVLHCVRPIAMAKYPVYIQNSREYAIIETENFGKTVQMEVGALMVGKIHNHKCKRNVKRGAEKGYFEFGGSTVILLIREGKMKFLSDILKELDKREEVPVKMGMCIGMKVGGK